MTRFVAATALILIGSTMAQEKIGETRIARWKDDKKAALMMFFDDSLVSHIKNAIPALQKRGMVGTFYINPGSGYYEKTRHDWETDVLETEMELGNHTMTHEGARDFAHGKQEIEDCASYIRRIKKMKRKQLLSFGKPGVKTWELSDDEQKRIIQENYLVPRPLTDGRSCGIHLKTPAQMFRPVKKAIKEGVAINILFHGVGGEWHSVAMKDFADLLNRIDKVKDQVWVDGHIAVHKYATQRDNTKVKMVEVSRERIKLKLRQSSRADKELYDGKLTLITEVPASWKECKIKIGRKTIAAATVDGKVIYNAKPNCTITITKR